VQEPGVIASSATRPGAAAAPFAMTGQLAVLRAEEARRSREVSTVADMAAVQSQTAQRLAQAETGLASDSRGRRTVAGRTFVLRNGEWHDSRHAGSSAIVSIEPYSAAYFALLQSLPELTAVLRELDTVLVAGGRASIRFAAGGRSAISTAEAARLAAGFRER
jgi:hypothetical protein